MVRPAVKNMVMVLVGGTALVLLIASANVANLLMARAWSRRREMGVRAALGASKSRVFQQTFVESATLALFGGTLGVLVGSLSLQLVAILKPEGVDLALDVVDKEVVHSRSASR
jgi:ABC-type antimicrobial peptide transport system permease subunit